MGEEKLVALQLMRKFLAFENSAEVVFFYLVVLLLLVYLGSLGISTLQFSFLRSLLALFRYIQSVLHMCALVAALTELRSSSSCNYIHPYLLMKFLKFTLFYF